MKAVMISISPKYCELIDGKIYLIRPPQSWCYVEQAP